MFDTHDIIELDTKDLMLWKYADRREFEMGNLQDLADDIKKNGQIQPIIVREGDHDNGAYEIIAGQRRWRACILADVPVAAVIRNLNDTEALLIQTSENIKKRVSPYSKACCYGKIIEDKKISQVQLARDLGISKGTLNDLLSFNDVPEEIWLAVKDVSKISIRTAMFLKKIVTEDPTNINKLILIAHELRKGIGKKTINFLLKREGNSKKDNIIYDNFNNKIITIRDKEIKLHEHFYQYASKEDFADYITSYLNKKLKRSDI